MCKLFSVVYFSLFLVIIVDCFGMQNGPSIKEDIQHPNHHQRLNKTITLKNVANKTSDGGVSNPTTTEEPEGRIEEKDTEKLFADDNAVNSEEPVLENAIEDNFGRTGDTHRKIFMDTSAKTQEISGDESYSGDDYSDSDQSSKVGSVDDLTDEAEHNNHSREVLIKSPYIKTLSQDAVLDLKARSGHIRLEEGNSDGDLNVPANNTSSIEHLPQFDSYLRSGYIPPDEVDNFLKLPENTQNDVYHLNRPIFPHRNGQPSQFNKKNNSRPEMLYNTIQNSQPRNIDTISGREIYPIQNSREIWAQGTGQRTKSDFGVTHPSNQYTMHCPMCTQGRYSSRERSFQAAAPSKTFETGNGRSVQFDPLGANDYPLVQDKVVENVKLVQPSYNEILYPGSKETYAAKEVHRNVQLTNIRSDPGPLSKVLLTLPSYVARNAPLFWRVGLGGPRFVNINE